jgi:hypothetical protein
VACFHFSLHNSPFILAAERPTVGFIDWLGLTGSSYSDVFSGFDNTPYLLRTSP